MLVSPLDWGLGHTTRCIPIIQTLLKQGCDVIIACNSRQKELLAMEFPDLRFVHLDGYDIRYGKNRWLTLGWLFVQGGKILTKIKQEKRWLNKFLAAERVDAIISDNRFGLFSANIPSIFITHQLQIRTGLGIWVDAIARRWNYKHIENFKACWIPDIMDQPSVAGILSHPKSTPRIQTQYIGVLSRMLSGSSTKADTGLTTQTSVATPYTLIILSGPEPQRTLLEQQLLTEIDTLPEQFVLVRGVSTNAVLPIRIPVNCKILHHAPTPDMYKLIQGASLVISRCGYTTVMDLLLLQKNSILIPTPGQAEQEYLASHLLQHQWAYTISQQKFHLQTALEDASHFPYRSLPLNSEAYQTAVAELVQSISQ